MQEWDSRVTVTLNSGHQFVVHTQARWDRQKKKSVFLNDTVDIENRCLVVNRREDNKDKRREYYPLHTITMIATDYYEVGGLVDELLTREPVAA